MSSNYHTTRTNSASISVSQTEQNTS